MSTPEPIDWNARRRAYRLATGLPPEDSPMAIPADESKPAPFCSDCRWFEKRTWIPDTCQHPNVGISVVTGKPNFKYCSEIRAWGCGVEGKWFEPKSVSQNGWFWPLAVAALVVLVLLLYAIVRGMP